MGVAANGSFPRFVMGFVLAAAGCAASASVGPAPAAVAPLGASAAPLATPPSQPPPPPTTAEGCKSCNGIWATHGIAQTESCNCRTTDGGKRCRDGAECQGLCVAAEQPEREIVEAGPPPRGYFVGKCSETVAIFGCYRSIDKGATSKGPVPLGEPPAALCAD